MAQIKNVFAGVASAVVITGLLLSGCGGGEKKKADTAPQKPVASKTDDTTAKAPTPPQAQKEEPKPEPRKREKISDPVTGSMSYMDNLMRDGAYKEALRVADELLIEIGDSPKKTEVQEYAKNLKELLAFEQELAPKLVGLKTNDAKLEAELKADERSLLVLRNVVRDNADPEVTIGALRYLRKVEDVASVNAVYQAWKKNTGGTAEDEMIKTLTYFIQKESSGKISEDLLVNMMLVQPCQTSDIRKKALRGLIDSWRFDRIPQPRLDAYAQEIRADRLGQKRHLVELLALVYERVAGSNSSKFDGMFSEPILADIRRIVRKSCGSGSAPIRNWGKLLSPRLGLVDYKTLETDLILHFSFNGSPSSTLFRDTLSPKTLASRIIPNQKPRRVEALEGYGFRCGGKMNSDGHFLLPDKQKVLLRNMSDSYSYSIWVNPTKYPSDKSHFPFAILVGKELRTVGLRIYSTGRVSMVHPTEEETYEAMSNLRVAIGQWSHVVGTVDRTKGKICIYVNGQLAGQASFTPGSPVHRAFRNANYGIVGAAAPANSRSRPVFDGGAGADMGDQAANELRKKKRRKAREARGDAGGDETDLVDAPAYDKAVPQKEFNGIVDELRIYMRAIDQETVKSIYGLHSS